MKYMSKIHTISKVLLIFVVWSCGMSSAAAQKFSFEEKKIALKDGDTRSAIQVILEPEIDRVRDAFDEFMDDYHDVHMNTGNLFGKHRIIEAEEVTIDAISPNKMNFSARIIENGAQTELSVFGSFGLDLQITEQEYPVAFANMKNLTMQFVNHFIPNYFSTEVNNQKEEIADFRDDIDDLNKDIAKNHRKIEELKEENTEMEQEKALLMKKLEEAENDLDAIKQSRVKTREAITRSRKIG